jgi:hypothetical protein
VYLRPRALARKIRKDRLDQRLDEVDELFGERVTEHGMGDYGIREVGGGTNALLQKW